MRALGLTLLLLLVPASLAGASSGAEKHSKVALVACDTTGNTATFRGSMTTFAKASSLQLRFTLQAKVPGGGGFKRIVAPGLDEWLTSVQGKKGYIYDKAVENLSDGASYRAVVSFRWRGAKGKLLASAVEVTPACAQPDERPNLKVLKVTAGAGPSPATRTYVIKVANRGRGAAGVFATGLTVNGKPLADRASAGPLAGKATTEISFAAPKCNQGSTLTAEVDTAGVVAERDETDNMLAVPCPTGSRNGRGLSLD